MLLTLCILSSFGALVTSAPTTPVAEPPNGIRQCARSECPRYTALDDYDCNMFKRRIEPGLWAYKLAPTCNISEATSNVYLSLHYYFYENNITRTTPIVLGVSDNKARPSLCPEESNEFPCCPTIYSLQFYIPQEAQATAPPPSLESGVHLINSTEPREYYGITLIGRPTLQTIKEKYVELSDFLEEQDYNYDDDAFMITRYDAPWRPLPHRSEVLIPVKFGNPNKGGTGDVARGTHGQVLVNFRKKRALDSNSDVDLIPY